MTITDTDIRNLRTESGAAGDFEMVRICDRALNGSAKAIDECVRVIEYAAAEAAMDEDDEEALLVAKRASSAARHTSNFLRPQFGFAHDSEAVTKFIDDGGVVWFS